MWSCARPASLLQSFQKTELSLPLIGFFLTLYLPSIASEDAAFQPTDFLNKGTRFRAQNVEFRTGEAEVFRLVQPSETLVFDWRGVWRFDAADWMSGNWSRDWSVECQIRCYHAYDYYRAEILLLDEQTAIEMASARFRRKERR